MGNETHENLLHEKFLTQIINKVCEEALFIHARVTLEYFNFKRENVFKSLVSTFIASAITACCRATAGGNAPGGIHI